MSDILTGITIRPSSVDTFLNCPQQWYRVFLLGQTSIPNARAAIGTGIHKGVEVMWQESMKANKKDINIGMMADAAVQAFDEEGQKDLQYDDGEDANTARRTIVQGVEAYADDIAPYAPIPNAVEKRFTIHISNHPIISAVSGTVDYIDDDTIADVKTSKRKPTTSNYKVQQSIYKILARANGVNVQHSLIHGVVLKKEPEGLIKSMNQDIDEAMAKYAVNSVIDTTAVLAKDIVDPDILFRGNPKYYLCSPKYCAFYNSCKFVQGDAPEPKGDIPVVEL